MHFDLPDLRLFIHVAEACSMTGGAQRAHLSTAAASTRMKALEGQLGSRLFYRSSQGVELTPAGERLLRHARTILRQVEHVKSDFSEYADGAAGHLRIFANTTAVTEFMPEVLARFLATRPGITVDLQERLTRDIVRGVLDGTADLGIVAGVVEAQGLQLLPFSLDRLVLAVPRGHALADRPRVSFHETLDYPHVGLHDGSTLLQFLQDQVKDMGRSLPLRIQVLGFEPACRMIEAGVGIGILPESCALRYQRTLAIQLIELEDAWAQRERSIVVRELEALPSCGQELLQAIFSYEGFTPTQQGFSVG
ncbi:LysR substrate-binding domain-containing protein [Halomonas sp. HP20-15]|uniref:LysR substrate-binding domain-containing protein n=1 Tax=Halomonas sp. HP20-15 TaxID=3085901 RepID=UPI002981AC9E|nr:LysR substrate-binding domain-containing protein [Halomonas sp. HP20-15]MDW5375988.1 LysR substrate-binding domain-containing protein [Halomonas sp. HP20-15]